MTRRTAAERRIARLMEDESDAPRRSVLATLRGALLLEEARNSPVQRHVFLRRAIEQFRRASELDPTNADAVFDLELALKLLRETGGGTAGSGDRRAPLPSPGAGVVELGLGLLRADAVAVSFLTPLAAAVGLVVVLAVWARVVARRRAAARGDRARPPLAGRARPAVDLGLLGLVGVLVALAAAQPVVSRSEATHGRDGAEVSSSST